MSHYLVENGLRPKMHTIIIMVAENTYYFHYLYDNWCDIEHTTKKSVHFRYTYSL
jgi:hypothetical protein